MRLGGWCRLGIFFSVLYGLLLAFVFYSERPRLERLQNDWFNEAAEVIAESISKAEGREISASEVRNHLLKEGGTETVSWLEKVSTSPSQQQKLFSEAVARVNKKYEDRIAAMPNQQRDHWLIALACWVGGTLLLFGVGWTTRWVYRGFRPN